MPPEEVYLDNSATSRPYPEVIEEMARIMEDNYGNPSSLHKRGTSAERILSSSRQALAELLGVKSREIIFTSGGTESNNLAILGLARRYRRRGDHLITSSIEHSSVLEPFRQLEREGFKVTYLPPDEEGFISPEKVSQALTPRTILVSIMHVNNEVGTIQPIYLISRAIKEKKPDALFHVDGVQSFTKIPLRPGEQGIDALSLSAHKFHGPKGAGLLYLREGIHIEPLFRGGGQEEDKRPGTENTPAIAAMALAARISFGEQGKKVEKLFFFKEKIISSLQERHPWMEVNGARGEKGAPHILNISFPGLKGEVLLHALEKENIYVSTGSACHSREKKPSHVLKAMGLDEKRIEGALRVSLSFLNTEEEIDYALEKIDFAIRELKALIDV